ncbi:MAG TPA: ABC transporter ATP-binding protein [Propionibacteriaceae bacterium]|nr:ABC transporter ATP-binding protein [Propionibacteriaceae bacterium]
MSQNILELRNVDVCLDAGADQQVRILRDLSLDIERGSFVAIVGESGCGKSITVHSIVKLLPENLRLATGSVTLHTDDGSVRLDTLPQYGREIRSIRGGRIGMIFQDTLSSLNPAHKVGRQVMENLLEHTKLTRAQAKARTIELFGHLGIPDPVRRFDAYPHEMSGGMRQRVMIAIALACNPDLIIADEPTTALDVTIQAQIMELLKRLQAEQRKTFILITHNMGLVAEVADAVAVMYLGRVVEWGTREQVLRDPRHPYTAALLQSVPSLGMDRDRELLTVAGQTPNPAEVQDGCEFAGRCPFVQERCRTGEISMRDVGDGHQARCVLAEDTSLSDKVAEVGAHV